MTKIGWADEMKCVCGEIAKAIVDEYGFVVYECGNEDCYVTIEVHQH